MLAALGISLSLTSFEAQALPSAPSPLPPSSETILIRGGCGLGWHRGPWGGCRPNGYWRRPGPRCWWRGTPWGPRRVCAW
ncbi:GCG_CRPN prefix-to-repeats domain-containing protein [Methylocella tundrae]